MQRKVVLTRGELKQILACLEWVNQEGWYYGNKELWIKRSLKIMDWVEAHIRKLK